MGARAAGTIARVGAVGLGGTAVAVGGAVLTVGALLVAATGALNYKMKSGRSFENMGANLNKEILGDIDDEARASMMTRQQMSQSGSMMRMIAQEGRVNSTFASIFEDLKKINKRDVVGRSLIEEDQDFQGVGTLDQLITKYFVKVKTRTGQNFASDEIAELRKNYWRLNTTAKTSNR